MTEKQKIARLYRLQKRLYAASIRLCVHPAIHDTDVRLTRDEWFRLWTFVMLVHAHLRETRNDYETVSRRKLAAALKELVL